uniref:NADH-ubiquinone oxidoreductase chain 3 n=1 Tax=Synapturanus sp. MZUSP 159223 TaxID=2877834 RepID=A0A8K1LY70_9NEOB|nr:NADH dehydrogenase subunit 3 [Synapturanus sp. MZUSP 159223]
MLSYLTTTLTLSTIVILLSFWLPTMKPDSEKLSPYECGFNPIASARLPYSMRFFLVAILFLLFDLEIALLLPSPWASQFPSPFITVMWVTIILLILTLGLVYEWFNGGLEWAK